jgi:hypothetical protein
MIILYTIKYVKILTNKYWIERGEPRLLLFWIWKRRTRGKKRDTRLKRVGYYIYNNNPRVCILYLCLLAGTHLEHKRKQKIIIIIRWYYYCCGKEKEREDNSFMLLAFLWPFKNLNTLYTWHKHVHFFFLPLYPHVRTKLTYFMY